LFGGLGFHNFYAGHVASGAIKLVLFLVTFVMDLSTGFYSAFSLVWLAIAWLWALVEAFAVKEDIRGNPLH
jgi:TM2 domain-containing membrane protein YozV